MIPPETVYIDFRAVMEPSRQRTEEECPVILCNTDTHFAMAVLILERKAPAFSLALICFLGKKSIKMRNMTSNGIEEDHSVNIPTDLSFVLQHFEYTNLLTIEEIKTQCLYIVQSWMNNSLQKARERLIEGILADPSEINEKTVEIVPFQTSPDQDIGEKSSWLMKHEYLIDTILKIDEGLPTPTHPMIAGGHLFYPSYLLSAFDEE